MATKNSFAGALSILYSPEWSCMILISLPLHCMVVCGVNFPLITFSSLGVKGADFPLVLSLSLIKGAYLQEGLRQITFYSLKILWQQGCT